MFGAEPSIKMHLLDYPKGACTNTNELISAGNNLNIELDISYVCDFEIMSVLVSDRRIDGNTQQIICAGLGGCCPSLFPIWQH